MTQEQEEHAPNLPQRQAVNIDITDSFNATPEQVFTAWTTPEALAVWVWGSLGQDVSAEVDLRIGGLYAIYTDSPDDAGEDDDVGKDDDGGVGERAGMCGLYVEIVPGKRLVYTQHWDASVGYNDQGNVIVDEVIIVDFTESEDGHGTEVRFRQYGIPDDGQSIDGHVAGVSETLDYLKVWLSE